MECISNVFLVEQKRFKEFVLFCCSAARILFIRLTHFILVQYQSVVYLIIHFNIANSDLQYLLLESHSRRVTRGGEGKSLPCPFSETGKKCPNLWKKMP